MHFHEQHLQASKDHLTDESYSNASQPVGAATATLNNNSAGNCNNEQGVAAANKTSDLGDELPGNECENVHALCHHVAHLTLIDGCDNVAGTTGLVAGTTNLDSDGMSSETQRSFTTNGSPSSGVAEMVEHQHRGQLLTHYKLATSSSGDHHFNQPANVTSSSEQEQFDMLVGGTVIGVNKQQTNSDLDEQHVLRANQKANSFKNGKKIVSINPN